MNNHPIKKICLILFAFNTLCSCVPLSKFEKLKKNNLNLDKRIKNLVEQRTALLKEKTTLQDSLKNIVIKSAE